MKTITANEFYAAGGQYDKFPHTGPIYYSTGARPYGAALKGVQLKSKNGYNLEYKTAEAAERAILKAAKETA